MVFRVTNLDIPIRSGHTSRSLDLGSWSFNRYHLHLVVSSVIRIRKCWWFAFLMEGGQALGPAWLLDTIAVSGNVHNEVDRNSNDHNDNLSPRARFAVHVSVRTRRDII